MKTAFISDIHGNHEALKAVLSAIDRLGITRIICAGDVVGYYTQINECCLELRTRHVPTVLGNHDWYLGGGGFCPRSKSVNDCLVYQRKVINAENLAWLRSLPVRLEEGEVQIVHGGWADPLDEYLAPSSDYLEKLDGKYFVSGHTHVPCIFSHNGKVYCNPGSVGQPRDCDPRAAFAVFDGSEFEIHRVAYEMQPVFDLMNAAGFNDYYYGGLKYGSPRLRRLNDPA
jgi:putative phosphoesterase